MTTPHITTSVADSIHFVPLVELTNTSGVLTAIGVAGGEKYHYFRLTIDGSELVNDYLVGANNGFADSNGGLGVALPFCTSLKVEIRDDPDESSLTKFWATYRTDHSSLESEPEEFEEKTDAGRQVRYRRSVYRRFDGETYVLTELIGPLHWSRVVLSRDTIIGDEPISGQVELFEYPSQTELSADSVSLVVRLAGRSRRIQDIEVGRVEGTRSFTHSLNELATLRGHEFEIRAELHGFTNVPARFTVL